MADNVSIKDAANTTVVVLADEVTDGTLGTGEVQFLKLMGGALNDTTKVAAATAALVGNEGGLVVRPIEATGSVAATAITTASIAPSGFITTLDTTTPTSGSFAVYSPPLGYPMGAAVIAVKGTFTGTLYVDISDGQGSGWVTFQTVTNAATGAQTTTIPSAGLYLVPMGGLSNLRVRLGSAGVPTGLTVAITMTARPLVALTPVVQQGTNPWTIQGNQGVRNTGNITTAASVVGPFTANNFNIATVTLSGTYTGVTAVFEGSDDGNNWYPLQGCRTDASLIEPGPVTLSSTLRAWDIAIGGMSQLRVRATAWASGTAVIGVTFQSMPYEPSPAVGLANVGGTAIAVKAVPTGGNGQAAIPVYTNTIQALTYTFGARNIATGALTANTAKQVLSLEVAAGNTKTVKIRRIIVSGVQTTALAGTLDMQLTRGSAASTLGTAVTAGVRVTGDVAPQTVVKTLPTITAATVVDTLPCFANPTTTAVGGTVILYDWQEDGETKPWTLKPGVIDSLVLNAISTAAQNWTLTIHITLTEE